MGTQILVLAEGPESAQQVVDSLSKSGHTVVVASNFTEAINILQRQHFSLIISDVHLVNGGSVFEFLRWVKKHPTLNSTLFALFSLQPTPMAKYLEDGIKTASRVLGASIYITMECFDSEKFREQVDSLLDHRTSQVCKQAVK